ncbi:histidine phosphatase family protein [Loigolactobacillus binensis]|uniref:Histidine phosphatase family protein n=1 Tax=Loigolactobacillus binensis TaxID=2559922 RepID=A0ABW3EG21_9LACO|nr:histidine phosphatase family protein [Loigolactobacillus binensis]
MTELTVYLVRHGQTYFNRYNRMQGWADSPLTEQGILDAEKVGQRLAKIKFNHAYCSDTGRARSTARVILKANTVSGLTEPEDTPFFREEFYGYFEGMNSPEAWYMTGAPHGSKTYADIISDYSIDASKNFMKQADPFHDAENSTEYWNRLLLGFDMVRRENPAGTKVLLVSHGTTTRSIVGKFGAGQYDLTESPRNGSVTKLILQASEIKIAYYNRIDEGPLE